MEEPNPTASAIIGFAGRLEDNSSKFYEMLAEKFPDEREIFLVFAKESEKNKMLVTRTYQETITDAIEACFSFKGLNLCHYLVETKLTKDTSYPEALKMAIELEKKASGFYSDVAEKSKPLLATIPKAFEKVATMRNKRNLKLKSLLDKVMA